MVLLMLFALLAGAGTALSPCVLPVLPAVLSAGVTGGRRRPLGVVTGLVLSFTFAVVALVYVIHALGLPDDLLRNVAIGVLFAFGFTLLVPSLSDRIEAAISRLAPGPHGGSGDGFGSGFLLGFSLGFVYAPCAGPILAGVITVSAAQNFTAGRLAVALAYAIGSGVVLYALMAGGRRLTDRLAPIRGQVQMAIGAVMVCVATLMAFSLDTRFQSAIASDLPSFLVNPTGGIEKSSAIEGSLAGIHTSAGGGETVRFPTAQLDQPVTLPPRPAGARVHQPRPVVQHRAADDGGPARPRRPDRLLDLHLHQLPPHAALPRGLVREVQGPGPDRDRRPHARVPLRARRGNVAQAIADNHITYPVVQDNDYGTWDAYGNRAWPADYLIDANGNIRDLHEGEGNYEQTEQAIRTLLHDAGHGSLGAGAEARGVQTFSPQTTTPESYLGSARAQRFVNGAIKPGNQNFGAANHHLPPEHLAYNGNWDITPEAATAGAGATLNLSFNARQVFLVLGSQGATRPLRVELDGKPVPAALAGSDVRNGVATIDQQRLYRLVDLPAVGRHRLTLHFAPGISGYAFTFG